MSCASVGTITSSNTVIDTRLFIYYYLMVKQSICSLTCCGDFSWSSFLPPCRLLLTYFNAEDGRGLKLTIKPVQRDDTGFYVCTSKNAFGHDSTTAQLTAFEVPDPPSDLVVTGLGSRRLRLAWTSPFDGNAVITACVAQLLPSLGDDFFVYWSFDVVQCQWSVVL